MTTKVNTVDHDKFKNEKFLINICDQEPIHIPGSIQNFGFVLVLGSDGNIQFASENLRAFTSREYSEFLGKDLSEVLGDQKVLNQVLLESNKIEYFYDCTLYISEQLFDIAILPATTLGYRTIEFQPVSNEDLDDGIEEMLDALQSIDSKEKLYQVAVEHIRKVIGYSRVKFYLFDEYWNGDVLAESKEDFMPSYYGMRFPHSDIPKQARALYVRNKTRVIANVQQTPIPILPKVKNSEAIDLSDSGLRSISPIHIEYLRNMGVGASFSVSVVQGNKLVGLFACHNHEPKSIGLKARKKCEIIGRVVSIEMKRLELEIEEQRRVAFQKKTSFLTDHLRKSESIDEGVVNILPQLMKLMSFDGIAIGSRDEYISHGLVIDSIELLPYERSLLPRDKRIIQKVTAVSSLEEFQSTKNRVAGFVRIPIDINGDQVIYGFRKARVKDIIWGGGDPSKAKNLDLDNEGEIRVSPRKSFEAYKIKVKDQSEPFEDDVFYQELSRVFFNFIGGISDSKTRPKKQSKYFQALLQTNLELKKQIASLKLENSKLYSSEQKLNLALESGSIGTWEYNVEEQEVVLDLKCIDLLDANELVMSFEDFMALIPGDDTERFRSALDLETLQSEDLNEEIRYIHDDDERIFSFRAQVNAGTELDEIKVVYGTIQDITAFRMLRSEIDEVNYELQQFFYSDLLGTFIADEQGEIIRCNDYFLELLGFDKEFFQIGSLNWRTLSPIDQYPKDLDMIKAAMEGERTTYVKQFFDSSGKRVDTLFGLSYSKDSNKFYAMVKNHSLEVVQRQKAERLIEDQRRMLLERHEKMQKFNLDLINSNAELKKEITMRKEFEKSARLLEHAIDSASEMVLITDSEFVKTGGQPKITYVNQAMLDLSGYTKEDLLGQSPKMLQNRNTSDDIKGEIRKSLNEYKPVSVRIINEGKNGNEYVVDLSISPVFDDHGKCINFVGVQKDVTEEVQQQFEKERAEHHFKMVIENLPGSLLALSDSQGNITYTTGANSHMLKKYSNAFVAFNLENTKDEILTALELEGQVFDLEGKLKSEDYLIMVQQLNNFKGEKELIFLAHNVSDKKKVIDLREKALAQASELAEMKTQFINTASHQLKTPMSSIELNLELLSALKDEIENPKFSKIMARLKDESNRLLSLMDETLQISRINSNNFNLTEEDIDLVTLIGDQKELFLDTRVYGNRSIKILAPKKKIIVHTDLHLFRHAFHNILSNALKYSEEEVEVEVSPTKSGKVNIYIRDKGIGIPKGEIEKLMTEFFRATNARNSAGTGLGMYLVKVIMSKLNGSIKIDSIEGKGTTVTISI